MKRSISSAAWLPAGLFIISLGASTWLCGPSQTFAQGTSGKHAPAAHTILLEHKWIPSSVPDPRIEPGSVFSYDPSTHKLRYVTSLRRCGVPDEVLNPVLLPDRVPFEGAVSYGADALLYLQHVHPGPKFREMKSVSLTLDKHAPVGINLFGLRVWLTDPKHTISATCRDTLSQPNTLVALEAYKIFSGTFISVEDQKGAVRSLTEAVSWDTSASLHTTQSGSLEFTQDLYAAVRHLVPLSSGFGTMGGQSGSKGSRTLDLEVLSAMGTTQAAASKSPESPPAIGTTQAAASKSPESPPVYNAVFAPTLDENPKDLIDGEDSSVSFFIGPRDIRSAIDSQNWTVNRKLLNDKRNLPLVVTMTCTFCKNYAVQMKALTYFGSKRASTKAQFHFIPLREKIENSSGISQINFQIADRGLEIDYVVVQVRVNTAKPERLPEKLIQRSMTASRALEQRPGWKRDVDLKLSIRSHDGLLEASLVPNNEIEPLFAGKHLDTEGHPRYLKTGMMANELPELEGQLYLELTAEIRKDQRLKSILTGSTSSGEGPINDLLLTDRDKQRLLKLLADHTGAWYHELFVTGADADLREMMESFRKYTRTDRPVRLRIQAEGIYLPWQLLIPPTGGDVDARDFWGFRYEISINPTFNLPGPDLGPLVYHSGPLIYAHYRGTSQGDNVARLGEDWLKVLRDTLKLPGVVPVNSRDMFRENLRDKRKNVQIVLTFTHAENGTTVSPDGDVHSKAGGPKLIFSDGESLPVSEINKLTSPLSVTELSWFPSGPIVFLNGCETGTAGFFATTNQDFAGTFLRMGARGVIVTEASIWSFFGYNFGNSLLHELRSGQPITAALLKVRLSYLDHSKNPLGLLYTYYGGSDASLKLQ